MVFFISKYKAIFKSERVIYRHKLTWQVDFQRFKKLHAIVWQKLITAAKEKAKIEMLTFS